MFKKSFSQSWERPSLLSYETSHSRDVKLVKRKGYGALIESSKSEDFNTVPRHINLTDAIGILISSLAGTGIFISPTGVTKQVGSVGTTLILWGASGAFSLLLALCYAELGTALPRAGGDYAYIHYVLGSLPSFLCLWIMVVLSGPCTIAVTGRTVATYLNTWLSIQCYDSLVIVISLWITVTAAAVNCWSVKWTARLVAIFSVAKIGALGIIIAGGIYRLSQGHFGSLVHPFKNSSTDPVAIISGFLPALFAYNGWSCINALAEEMVNPRRDLPLASGISLFLITVINILVNVAYFTVLNPKEMIRSEAVAVLFAERAMPTLAFLIPLFVSITSVGSIFNLFLTCPRWAFAGGRDGTVPRVLSYVNVDDQIPIPAILLTAGLGIVFCLALFLRLQDLLGITSLISQIKIALALVALIILKIKEPDKPSTVNMPMILVVLLLIILLMIIIVPVWQTPGVAGIALFLFILGVPLYYIKEVSQYYMPKAVFGNAYTTDHRKNRYNLHEDK